MKKKSNRRLIVLLSIIAFTFILTSCHSVFLNLEIRTDGTVAWNNDRTAFAFITRTSMYEKPIGIARFPDGGKAKDKYLDFSLYHFDIKHKELTHLTDLNEFYLGSAYRWLSISQIALKLQNFMLFYKLIKPYDYNMKYIDKNRHPNFLKDISRTYSINILTHQKSIVDTTVYKHLFNNKREKLRFSSARSYLSGLKYSDWGINLKKFCPQSKSTYMNYIIRKEGNDNMRLAIFEQILPEFTKKDKEYILDKMQKQEQILYNNFNKIDEKRDPYRRSIRKDKYDDYILYMKDIKNKLFNY